jgi:hypothetical protein
MLRLIGALLLSVPNDRGLLWAEDRTALKEWDSFADHSHNQPRTELSRRMFLYRTALQARRIAAATKARPGGSSMVIFLSAFGIRRRIWGTLQSALFLKN